MKKAYATTLCSGEGYLRLSNTFHPKFADTRVA
jgi:hypothetical protein